MLSTREVRDLIGVEVVGKKLSTGLPADEIIKPLRRMVLDLVEKRINVSRLKNKVAQTAYVRAFHKSDKPDLSKKGSLNPIDSIHRDDF